MNEITIVVDMLNDFVHEKGVLSFPEARKIVPYIKNLIEKDEKIIYLKDEHEFNDKEFKIFPQHAIKGTWGSKIIDELKPSVTDIVIPKNRYSGFFNTNLDSYLKVFNPSKVTVVGVCTSICVMDTVGGLRNRDFYVVISSMGVADFDQEMHEMALKRMKNIYGVTII